MVAHLLKQGDPWALLLEIQIVPDAEMFGRILAHIAAIWRAEGRMATLLEILKEKFGELPDDMERKIREAADVDRLRLLTSATIKAETLEDFRRKGLCG